MLSCTRCACLGFKYINPDVDPTERAVASLMILVSPGLYHLGKVFFYAVVPFVHSGMEQVIPPGASIPRAGANISVLVGRPIAVDDLLAAAQVLSCFLCSSAFCLCSSAFSLRVFH